MAEISPFPSMVLEAGDPVFCTEFERLFIYSVSSSSILSVRFLSNNYPKSFSIEASFTQSVNTFVASTISSAVGNVGAIRIFESSGSTPYG